ncbi:hypothetical protein ACJMK2_027643 [Sinanodonta woodiana]|uniref:Uncharacterized protein n=1 Tax=Sinanodonta woodiana TaxID=1069815 RepID=A0ABD3X6F7_SINWO
MAAHRSVATAAANGDLSEVKTLIRSGADVNEKSKDGMTPLAIAAFWGYAEVVELLLKCQANVNIANRGTMWTPLHCAAFQGHGKVVMKLMEYQPDLMLKDCQGRTAVDFASALDAIWPIFAAAGCHRTPKSELLRMDIVKKVIKDDPAIQRSDYVHFSRPGSAYIMKHQPLINETVYSDRNMAIASSTGDVLAGIPDEPDQWDRRMTNPSFNSMWDT